MRRCWRREGGDLRGVLARRRLLSLTTPRFTRGSTAQLAHPLVELGLTQAWKTLPAEEFHVGNAAPGKKSESRTPDTSPGLLASCVP